MSRIGFLGAYCIDNSGDVLLGYAVRQALRTLLPQAEQRVYAPDFPQPFLRTDFSQQRGIDTKIHKIPANASFEWAKEEGLDALIIGGGGILSLEPCFRPFLLGDPAAFADSPPAAYCGVCSQNTPYYEAGREADHAAVRICCEKLRYVSVRNRSTLKFLRRCGFAGTIHQVPDPALLLSLPDLDGSGRAEIDKILSDSGVDPKKPIIGVSLGESLHDPRTSAFYCELFTCLEEVQRAVGRSCEVLFFPFGAVYGDALIQQEAATQVRGAKLLCRGLSALGYFRLIGRLALHIGTRYHAMLAAFAQDVPFLILDQYLSDAMATSKIREFIDEAGLEAFYLCPFLSTTPRNKLQAILSSLHSIHFTPKVAEYQEQLRAHYRAMAAGLSLV